MKEFRALVMVSNLKDKEYFVPGMTDGGWYGSSLGAECKEGYDEGGAYEGCFGGKWVGAADVGQLRPSCGSFATKNIVIAGGNNVLCNKDMMILTLTFFDGFALTYYEDKTGHRLEYNKEFFRNTKDHELSDVKDYDYGICKESANHTCCLLSSTDSHNVLSFHRISPNSFLSSILLLVVIIVMVVFVVVVLVVVAIVGVVIVVVFGIVVVVVPLVPVFLLGLLALAIDAACAFRAEEMPSLISCRMAAKVMAGVSDVDVLLGGILSTKDNA
ncbi:hypothetical protein Tco_1464974 [Tanacetum coccineum]